MKHLVVTLFTVLGVVALTGCNTITTTAPQTVAPPPPPKVEPAPAPKPVVAPAPKAAPTITVPLTVTIGNSAFVSWETTGDRTELPTQPDMEKMMRKARIASGFDWVRGGGQLKKGVGYVNYLTQDFALPLPFRKAIMVFDPAGSVTLTVEGGRVVDARLVAFATAIADHVGIAGEGSWGEPQVTASAATVAFTPPAPEPPAQAEPPQAQPPVEEPPPAAPTPKVEPADPAPAPQAEPDPKQPPLKKKGGKEA